MYQSPTKILKINIRRVFYSGSVHRTLIVELAHCVCVKCRGGGQCIQIMYSERERERERVRARRALEGRLLLPNDSAQRTFNMFKVPFAVSRVGTGFMYLFVTVLNTRRPLLYRSVHGLMVIQYIVPWLCDKRSLHHPFHESSKKTRVNVHINLHSLLLLCLAKLFKHMGFQYEIIIF